MLGRSTNLVYDEDGRLIKIRDFSGREFLYDYDALGLLERVQTPPVATFENGESDAKGQTWLSLTWGDADSDGYAEEVTSQVWGAGGRITLWTYPAE